MNAADRKRQLIVQGAVYRAEVVLSRAAVRTSLHPDVLARGALRRVAVGTLTAFAGARASGVASLLPVLLPLLVRGVAALNQHKRMRKTVLWAAALAAAAGAAFSWSKRKRG